MCISPLIRFRVKYPTPNGLPVGFSFTVKSQKELIEHFGSYSSFREYFDNYCDYQYIPCRNCCECKADYAKEWSIRCYHEFCIRKVGCFLTLTIDSSKVNLFYKNIKSYCNRCVKGNRYIHYPIDYTLCKGLILDSLKRMRDNLYKKYGIKIRYFGCGEYGSKDERPHYHVLIFGYNFNDKVFYKMSDKGINLFMSEELSSYWPYGMSVMQEINHGACMYTAKYVTKKLRFNNDQSEFETYFGREPEFLFMSKGNCQSNRCKYIDEIIKNCKGVNSLRNLNIPYCKSCDKTRGGLGYDWFLKYKDDVLKIGYITIEGIKYPIPNYYLKILKLTDLKLYDKYKLNLFKRVDELDDYDLKSPYRLNARKEILKKRLKLTRRE